MADIFNFTGWPAGWLAGWKLKRFTDVDKRFIFTWWPCACDM